MEELKSSEFVRKCFVEILADGKPHTYREIKEYAMKKSKGTAYENEIANYPLAGSINVLLGADSSYVKIRRGVYQWRDNNQVESQSPASSAGGFGDFEHSPRLLGKGEFIQKCFIELLADGKPHTHREIRAYAIEKAKGTEFEQHARTDMLTGSFNAVINQNSHYMRIKHGMYLRRAPNLTQKQPQVSSTAINPMLVERFEQIEKLTIALRKELKDTLMISWLVDHEKGDKVEGVYKAADASVKKVIETIGVWRAGYESPDVVDVKNDDSVKVKVEDYQDSPNGGKAMFKIEIKKQICDSEVFDLTIENLHYLYGKFQKYQIEPNPFFYKIGDTRKEGAKVRVYSESDFGNSALKLLQDHNNIYDAYLLQKGLGKVREELKEEIEQNILYEQYKNTEELFADIHEMTLNLANERLIFYCPLVGKDAKGDVVDNDTVLEYNDKIRQYLEIIFSTKRDLEEHIGRHSELMDKLLFVNWDAEELNGVLYGKIDCYLTESLSYEETERLRNTIHMQNTVGIGEEYKYQNMPVGGGELYISFENREGEEFLYTQEEMEVYLAQEQGGMKFGS